MSILGIDEVGRGPWAGPLVVGAVVLPDDFDTTGLADSKQLTSKKRTFYREKLVQVLPDGSWALGWVPAAELDSIGMSAALRLATRRAVDAIRAPFHEIIIDGTINLLATTRLADHATTLPKADALIPAVSAASIIAKVARDEYMIELASQYPDYGFERHVGYGTALHRQALELHGPTPEHRHSFAPIQHLQHTVAIGQRAERAVAAELRRQGHTIIAHNWRTPRCEIDLISRRGRELFFTEVKHRAAAPSILYCRSSTITASSAATPVSASIV
jgi:ribonuclease HII